ncbi:CheR family methyltransferase [Candidatus Phycosocius spiralis]|uniref:protein-glutamate O-methyltransferase n=1 Tax=Candidatus Phycosocius spiralis TaxID=2815099 RepID=A0ABQ4PXW0_9PROT|nr:protein-glutamate O-methyltransferase CheR [Candidatus Phycosocius spiralis]GIU67842.1 chemotaxis protein methyltransferase [Candidatus Phycosocius spiralis]
MKPADFDYVSNLVRERSGLILSDDKSYLVESRLAPIVRKEGYVSIEDLVGSMRQRRDQKLIDLVVDAMTTNETFFFRDKTPFDIFEQTIVPDLVSRKRGGIIKIWCAAASTGQEPYSLAMLGEALTPKLGGCKLEIIGTDISERCLEKAKSGVYTQFEVQRGLPVQMLLKHFKKEGESWKIDELLRSSIRYRTMNLLDDFRSLGRFDVIFCRNVLIYFDVATKKAVLERMAQQVEGPGYLLLGAAETVLGVTESFKPIAGSRGLYVQDPNKIGTRTAA